MFDPEIVKRLSIHQRDEDYPCYMEEGNEYVESSDYDQLLALYRESRKVQQEMLDAFGFNIPEDASIISITPSTSKW